MAHLKMIITQLIVLSAAIGCGQTHADKVHIKNENFDKASTSDTIALADLLMVAGDSTIMNYYLYDGEPYTGKAVEYEMANDGRWSFVYSFNNGVMQRLDVYGINGYQHRFVEMKNGKEYHTIMFHRNGNQYLETFYDENKNPIGLWKRWYESGELEWEKKYE